MRQVLCLASEPWTTRGRRTQQLMSRLENAQVLYFEPPAPLGSDLWKKPGRRLRPGVIVYTLPPVLIKSPVGNPLARHDAARAVRFIRSKRDKHRFSEPLLWCTSPAGAVYLDELPYRGLIYDCYRDWPLYPPSWEGELASAADVVFAASPDLMRHLIPCNGNVTLLPQGCNYPMFAKDDLPRPLPLRALQGPILGYAGTLWPDLDLTPLIALADAMPQADLVLVGRNAGCAMLPQLLEKPNVLVLGPAEPVDLPDFLCSFDVCLSLLRQDHLYDDVIPSRIFEYLSTGKPVVAMLRPGQTEHFPDVIYGARSPGDFVPLCARALAETGSPLKRRRRAYGQAAAWSVRAGEVCRILESTGFFS